MKLKTIIDSFSVKREGEEALILKVLDTIKVHKRRMELKLSYKEVKFVYDEFIKDQKNIAKKYIKQYCDEENEKNSGKTEWKELESDNIQRVPPHKVSKYRKEIEDLMDTDIPIKTPLKFTEKEIEDSKILFSEEMLIDTFIIPTKVSRPKKEKNAK
jgi:predicted nuclease with TOPRIM domain